MNADLTQLPPQGQFAAVNGIQLYYEDYGAGTPLVLLHGYSGTSQQFEPYIDAFAQHFRVIVPDLRGHGRSPDPTRHVTLLQMALDTFALLDQLGIERFKAIGDSAGSCALQYMASQQPARVEALILVEGGSYFPAQTRAALLEWSKTDDAELQEKHQRHLHGLPQLRALLDQLPPTMDDYATQPPDLSAITAKTLLIFGDHDHLYPLAVPVAMYYSLADAYLWIVPNAGHAFLLNTPDQYAGMFIPRALEFLQT